MKCPQCQHNDNPAGSKFCLACGVRLDETCVACGNDLPAGSRFCNKCGAPVSGLAERILTSKSALEGERKQVTVLFADLKGSMELLADRDPEEARRILDQVLTVMMDAVHRYEGTVNQVMGDGIMALFGAPLAHEDHALRACYAALVMQRSMKQYAATTAHGIPVRIRVGLNSGDVIVRSIGSDLRTDYTAVGQTTHLAARLEQIAEPGTILISADTLALVRGYVDTVSFGMQTLKGFPRPLAVHQLTGSGGAASRLDAVADARGLTPFTGRESQLRVLRDALQQAGDGAGRVVTVVGEPGIGKSRLYWHFTRSSDVQGWLVLQSRSVSYGRATPYQPITDLLRGYFDIQSAESRADARATVTSRLRVLDAALEPILPALLALLDLEVDDPGWLALDGPGRRHRTIGAIARLVRRISENRRVVLVFEDLHWIDSETQAVLDHLVDQLGSARILMLVNYRPEYRCTWRDRPRVSEVVLDPFEGSSAAHLVSSLIGPQSGVDELTTFLSERTQGNPFFLEEIVHGLVEAGTLVGAPGGYRLADSVGAIRVPPSVHAVLSARIDRLPEQDKRLLQSAAVVGKDVLFPLLEQVAEVRGEALRDTLVRLQQADFLYPTSFFPDLEYTFKHALTHEVTYDGILQDRRRALHSATLDNLEALYPDRRTEWVERLLHHAVRGEVWSKAVAYGHQAATRAYERCAYRQAVAAGEQTLQALARALPAASILGTRVDVRTVLYDSLWALGTDPKVMLAILDTARTDAETLGDGLRLATVLVRLTQATAMAGDHASAVDYGERALGLTTEQSELRGHVDFVLGQLYRNLGDLRRSVIHHERAAEFYNRGEMPMASLSRVQLGLSLAELGEFDHAIPLARAALALAEAADHPYGLVGTYWNLGFIRIMQGELTDAIHDLDRGLTLAKALNVPFHVSLCSAYLGYAYILTGRTQEGLALLERPEAARGGAGAAGQRYRVATFRAEGLLQLGRFAEAQDLAREALQKFREASQFWFEPWAVRLLAEIASRHEPPDPESAVALYQEAMAVAEPRGARPLLVRCHLGLARLYGRVGKRLDAAAHLRAADAFLGAMEMPTLRRAVKEELFTLDNQ